MVKLCFRRAGVLPSEDPHLASGLSTDDRLVGASGRGGSRTLHLLPVATFDVVKQEVVVHHSLQKAIKRDMNQMTQGREPNET